MLNMFRMLIHPSSWACDLFVKLFHGLYCSGSMYVSVTLWFGWGGVVSVCRLKHYLMLNMFRMLIHPSSGACDLFVEFVVVWLGWCGIRKQHTDTTAKPQCNTNTHRTRAVVVWYPYADTAPQPNHNVTPTHIKPEQYSPWNNSTNKSQAPEDGCINIRNMLSIK